MALSSDVKLGLGMKPTWPDQCVVCERPSPNHQARFTDRNTSIWTTIRMQFAKKVHVMAPACADCASSLERRHLLEKVVMWATTLGGVWLGMTVIAPMFSNWPKGLVAVLCGLAAYAPAVAVRILWAPPFGITAWDDAIDYEFASESYAQTFAELNDAEVR